MDKDLSIQALKNELLIEQQKCERLQTLLAKALKRAKTLKIQRDEARLCSCQRRVNY